MTVATGLMTAAQLFRMRDDGLKHELVDGRLTTMSPPGAVHGAHAGRIYRALAEHVERHQLGVTFIETGFKLATRPDTVFGPDVSFVAASRVGNELPRAYWDGAPDLAVEVLSPDDTRREVADKVCRYLARGTRVVWVIDPRRRTVVRHQAAGKPHTLAESETLTEPDVLPGFAYPLSALFAPFGRG